MPRWINLTDYEAEEDGRYRYDRRRDDDDRDTHVLALFERQHVQVGEKLRVLIYTPQHRGRLLLCIEGRTIVDYLLVPLDRLNLVVGGYRVVEIPIKPRYLPNFYLQGRLVLLGDELLADEAAAERLVEKQLQQRALEQLKDEGDGSEDPRWCRVDVIDPAARPGGQRLNVNIQTDEKTYRPGQQVAVRITTTDLKGNPCEAEVSLAAVDESVFSFGEDRLDLLPQCFGDLHPEQRFMRKTWRVSHGRQQVQHLARALAQLAQAQESLKALEMARTMDSLKQLAGIPGPMDLAPPPGVLFGELPAASLSLARLRVDFRETAAWQPQLRTDPGGRLATSLVLPDSLTRYRLTGVGLTRQTDIGIARTRINVTLPLAVQLFLPRFAVERDRLEAVGLLHNNSDRPRTCEVLCEVEGARVEPPDTSGNWRIAPGDGKTQVQGRVAVGAGQSARLTLPLAMDQLDEVKLTLRAADGQHADAEVRTLQVQPLGRPREVALSGTFNGEHQLQLPAGFMALDLRVSIARADVAGALEGLGYLIDYPYGCVEQTMSRFLPAVMVKRAAQESAVSLPPEAAEKLPDVLKKGLERLYNFQHDDGGWGWWEKDQSSPAMTIYVVYGLARCRNTGTEVHAEALRRGCDRLLGLLREGKMPPGDRPGAWLALALAGRADTALLGSDAQAALDVKQPDSATAYLALACRAAGLTEPGEQLAARLRAWEADSTEQLALKVTAQVTFGAPLADCRLTATRLLGRRHGPHWENTRTTAWAIEALSQMLRYDPAAPKPKRITVTVGNKKVLDLRRPEDLDPPVCRVHLDRSGLPKGEALAVRIKVEGEGAMNFTLSATGIQRLDCLQPEGTIIRLERSFSTLDGKPLGGRLRQGDVIAVRLALDLQQAQSYLIVEDRRPAGCEYADEQLAGPAAAAAANVEFRDDRLAAFFTHLPAGRHEIVYYLRAETRGTSNVLPAAAYPMYNDRLKGETGGARLEIE